MNRDERIAVFFVFVLLSSSFDFDLVLGVGVGGCPFLEMFLVLGGFWFWFSYAVRRILHRVSRVYQ